MSITTEQLGLYFSALIILFLTPGPVWFAIIARTVSGGAKSAVSLTLGVSLGDMLWPIIVFFALGFLTSVYSEILFYFRYLASIIISIIGIQVILTSTQKIKPNIRLTRAGFFYGFSAGFFAVTANPKASLFYLTVLPSFFDFNKIGFVEISIISTVSFSVPMIGNFFMILFFSKVRNFLGSQKLVKVINIFSGILLIFVGVIIGLT